MANGEINLNVIISVEGVKITQEEIVEFLNQKKFEGKNIEVKIESNQQIELKIESNEQN